MPHRHGKGWRGSVRVPGRVNPLRQGGFKTKAAAAQWERDTLVDHQRGTYRERGAGQMLFNDWAQEWLTTRGIGKRSAAVAEQSIVRTHLVPAFGTTVLDDLDALAVRKFVAELARYRAPKTVRNVHAVLFNVLQLAVQAGRLTVNPCAGTPLPKNRRRKPPAFLTEHEVEHLIAVTPDAWKPLTATLALTGLRWGEAVGLRVKRVDLLGGKLRVEESLNEAEGILTFDAPKSPAAIRTVTLSRRAVDVLLPLVAGRGGDELVFTSSTGLPVRHRNYYSRVWGPAVLAAGLTHKHPSPHDLRHTHASILIAAGVPLSAIKERLGHEDITTTDGLYGFLLPQVDQGVLAALDAAFPVSPEQHDEPLESPLP